MLKKKIPNLALEGHELVIAIFHFLGLQSMEGLKIPSDTSRLHQAFFNVSKKTRYTELFEKHYWLWQKKAFGPYCANLYNTLFNLELAGLIDELIGSCFYIVKNKLHNCWLNRQKNYTSWQLALLKAAAADIAEEFKKFENQE